MVGSDWRCGRLQADNAVHALDSVPVSLCSTDLFLWAGFLVLWNHTCSVAFCFLSCVWQWDKTTTPRCCSHWRTPSRWMGNAAAGRMLEKWAKCWRQQELPLLPYQSLLSPFHSCRTRKKQCENHPPSALPRQQVSSNRFSYLPGETCLPGAGLGEWTRSESVTQMKNWCVKQMKCALSFLFYSTQLALFSENVSSIVLCIRGSIWSRIHAEHILLCCIRYTCVWRSFFFCFCRYLTAVGSQTLPLFCTWSHWWAVYLTAIHRKLADCAGFLLEVM